VSDDEPDDVLLLFEQAVETNANIAATANTRQIVRRAAKPLSRMPTSLRHPPSAKGSIEAGPGQLRR